MGFASFAVVVVEVVVVLDNVAVGVGGPGGMARLGRRRREDGTGG